MVVFLLPFTKVKRQSDQLQKDLLHKRHGKNMVSGFAMFAQKRSTTAPQKEKKGRFLVLSFHISPHWFNILTIFLLLSEHRINIVLDFFMICIIYIINSPLAIF